MLVIVLAMCKSPPLINPCDLSLVTTRYFSLLLSLSHTQTHTLTFTDTYVRMPGTDFATKISKVAAVHQRHQSELYDPVLLGPREVNRPAKKQK